jgi:hypothetical protein
MKIASLSLQAMLVFASCLAHAQTSVTAEDRAEIQSLAARYSQALGSCDADGFAHLFAPESGFFASGFRGKVVGRERLVALVESERHCLAPNPEGTRGRPVGQNVPAVSLETGSGGVFGVVDLGAVGQYEDEYVRTATGWRFASRTVVTQAERAAGLDAREMTAIRALSADLPASDRYVDGENGKPRFMSSGVVIRVDAGLVGGRVHLDGGAYYDDVYERTAPHEWRVKARELVPAGAD